MTDKNDDCTQSTIIDILADHYPNHEPVVRYAVPDETGVPIQQPMLHHIQDPIPEEANWASAIYFISDRQVDRLREHSDNPYRNPSSENIAKTIQDECEDAGRVLYSVHTESDEHEDEGKDDTDPVPLPTMVDWIEEWVRTVIRGNPEDCTFFYSGNRSIHVHSPYLLTGANLRWLKKETKQFCAGTERELDASVYKRKQQFRIPGVAHESCGLKKAEIDLDWEHTEIIRAAAGEIEQPDTYDDVLKMLFSPDDSTELSHLLLSSSAEGTQSQSSSPLTEWPSRYKRPHDGHKDRAYSGPPFYPYPTGEEHDGRSVASIRVVDTSFQRYEAGKNRTFVPCYYYGAHSCSGREYTKDEQYAPLQLSAKDAQKWEFGEGETLAVIGGGNFESIFHNVSTDIAQQIGDLLDPEDGTRKDALDLLETKGYDVGSVGRSQPSSPATDQQQSAPNQTDSSEASTRAEQLQRRAEQGSVEVSLDHGERRDVANRLLKIDGWDYAWNWFREQYGSDFDPERTWVGLHRVIETFPADFAHIEVPPQP